MPLIPVYARQLHSSHKEVRPAPFLGVCEAMPQVGRSFTMLAERHPDAAPMFTGRGLITTVVLYVKEGPERIVTFGTVNSIYEIVRLAE